MYKFLVSLGIMMFLFGACNNNETKQSETKDSTTLVMPEDRTKDESQLEEVITRFVRAYAAQDNDKANKLIHPDLGFTVIYKPGVADSFEKVARVNFQEPIPAHFAYPTISNEYALVFESLPTFDCGTEQWSKTGFYCDTTLRPKQLSNIIAFENEFDEDKISEDELLKIEEQESNSYRVILTTKFPLIFHVQYYQGNWYVTTLDRAYASCEA